MKVDVVGEGDGLKGEGHALENHFLVEVWGAKGIFAEAVNKCLERLNLFLPTTEDRDYSSLMRTTASEMS